MAKGKHHKAIKYTSVTGGTQLLYRGGWANGTVAVATLYVGSRIFVLADVNGGFGQLVFGTPKSKPGDRALVRCISQLQVELQKVVVSELSCGEGAFSSVVADATVEDDPLGDAEVERGREDTRKRRKLSRSEYRHFAKKKQVLKEQPVEQRVMSMRFPKHPGKAVENSAAVVNVTCYFDASRQRCKGVWVCKEVFPWLVAFAAQEVANASGEELFPRDSAASASDKRALLRYSVGGSCWDLTWTDPSTEVMHTLQKKVPRRRFHRQWGVVVIPPNEFIAVKERTKQELLTEARHRGYESDRMGSPETL